MQATRRNIALMMSVGLILILLVGVGLWATNALGWRYWRVQEAEGYLGVDVPSDAEFATQVKPTRVVWLRFILPDDANADALAKALGISELRSAFTPFPNANPYEVGLAWWTPFNAAISRGGYAIHDGRMVEMAIDDAARLVYVRGYALERVG